MVYRVPVELFDMLVEVNKREAELGFSRVTVSVKRNERFSYLPTEETSCEGLQESAPDHIPGNRKTVMMPNQGEVLGQLPKHADEGPAQKRGLKEPYAEVGT